MVVAGKPSSPVVNSLICGQKHHIQAFQNTPLFYLTPQEQTDGIVECVECERELDFVGCRQRSDDVEVQVRCRFGKDKVRRKRVDVAFRNTYTRTNDVRVVTARLIYLHSPPPLFVFS